MRVNSVFLVVLMSVICAVAVSFRMGETSTESLYKRNCEEFGAISFVERPGQVTVYECRVKK